MGFSKVNDEVRKKENDGELRRLSVTAGGRSSSFPRIQDHPRPLTPTAASSLDLAHK